MISWILLLFGGLCEIGFVTMMKLSKGFKVFKYLALTILFMVISFYTLSVALKEIPMGVGYAIWSGIGAVGSVIIGMLVFKESRNVKKIIFISMIVIGIVGLKLSTN